VRQLKDTKVKVKIGPYINWFGPYQVARLVFFWKNPDNDLGPDEDIIHRFGTYLSGSKDKPSLLLKFCQWLYNKRKRKIQIHIDNYDIWSADHTLALIIHPILLKLKTNKIGSPYVDDQDVPEHLRSTNAAPKEHEYDTDESEGTIPPERDLVVDGLLNMADFSEETQVQLPEGPYETAGGYVAAELGRIPMVGDELTVDGALISVVEMDGRRVSRIRVQRTDRIGQ